ncbi:MAG: ABC transporter permease [Anaerolineaceae bacterium]|nr:ABC transporter permease [Anaerolineaceae bacterium]
MKIIIRLVSIVRIVFKRMLTQPGLVVAKMAGLLVGMTMVLSIPLYADAVNYRIFEEKTMSNNEYNRAFPPFTVLFHYVGAWQGAVSWNEIQVVDQFLSRGGFQGQIALPTLEQVQFIRTNNYPLFPSGLSSFERKYRIDYMSLAAISGFEDHVELMDGSFDGWRETRDDGYIPVMIHENRAKETGIQVGEKYILIEEIRNEETGEKDRTQIPIVVTGIYHQIQPSDNFWYMGSPHSLAERFILSEESYAGRLSEVLEAPVYSVSWFYIFDSANLHFDQAKSLSRRIYKAGLEAQRLLPKISVPVSPLESLQAYDEESRILTLYLLVICAPIIALVLIFIGMVSKIEVESRLNEIAILRSRGATSWQVILIEAIEALVLGLGAALIGIPLALGVVRLLGNTRSFLDFSLVGEPLRLQMNMLGIYTAVILVTVTVATQILPAIRASRHTITSYKQEQARLIEKPWWQRFYLDILLIAIVIYGMVMLKDISSNTEFFQNINQNSMMFSLLYLLPILLSIAVSLLFLRVLPMILAVISWVVGKTRNVDLLMAARALHRMPNAYQMPLMLLIITVSLAVFTTTLAGTFDRHLHDQTFYSIGSELRFIDYGENSEMSSSGAPSAQSGSTGQTSAWAFLPVEYYLQSPGAQSASRLGEYSMLPSFVNGRPGVFYAIDRLGFAQTAFWRDDFSELSLGELMNRLAKNPDGVLVSREFLIRYNLKEGDLVQVQVNAYGARASMEYRIVGVVDYFPTWYPEEGDLMVGNMDYLFSTAGGPFPYFVMMQTEKGADSLKTLNSIASKTSISWSAGGGRATSIIEETQRDPKRQGFFGLLTISFLSTALLSFLGFFLYAVFSLRRRFIELGVLRAIGLTTRQMSATLSWEFIFLIFGGAFLGTLVGILSSNFFVPYLQIGSDNFMQVPPYYISIAWGQMLQIYGLLFFLFVGLIIALVAFLRKIKIFEAIKLGETI